jgi:putative hydrolase of the HAD superfamily
MLIMMSAALKRAGQHSRLIAVIVDYAEVISILPSPKCAHQMAGILGLEQEAFQRRYAASRTLYDRGDIAPDEYWFQFASDSGVPVTSSQVARLRRLDVQMWGTVDQRMTNWLGCVGDAGMKTALLSNMISDLARHARLTFEWVNTLTCAVLSCEIGLAKPEKAIYQHCLARLQVKPAEALFIDDRATNVQAAREMGIAAIQFRSIDQLRDELAAMSFPILPSTIGGTHECREQTQPEIG